MEARPPLLPKVTSMLAGALVALGIQEHRPALNLLPLLLSSRRQTRAWAAAEQDQGVDAFGHTFKKTEKDAVLYCVGWVNEILVTSFWGGNPQEQEQMS